jgi:hypothetical protein
VDVEAHFRLLSVLEILEHGRRALPSLEDPRLDGALEAMHRLQAEIVAALATLRPLTSENQAGDRRSCRGKPAGFLGGVLYVGADLLRRWNRGLPRTGDSPVSLIALTIPLVRPTGCMELLSPWMVFAADGLRGAGALA